MIEKLEGNRLEIWNAVVAYLAEKGLEFPEGSLDHDNYENAIAQSRRLNTPLMIAACKSLEIEESWMGQNYKAPGSTDLILFYTPFSNRDLTNEMIKLSIIVFDVGWDWIYSVESYLHIRGSVVEEVPADSGGTLMTDVWRKYNELAAKISDDDLIDVLNI
jgi:hypothetical protein